MCGFKTVTSESPQTAIFEVAAEDFPPHKLGDETHSGSETRAASAFGEKWWLYRQISGRHSHVRNYTKKTHKTLRRHGLLEEK